MYKIKVTMQSGNCYTSDIDEKDIYIIKHTHFNEGNLTINGNPSFIINQKQIEAIVITKKETADGQGTKQTKG